MSRTTIDVGGRAFKKVTSTAPHMRQFRGRRSTRLRLLKGEFGMRDFWGSGSGGARDAIGRRDDARATAVEELSFLGLLQRRLHKMAHTSPGTLSLVHWPNVETAHVRRSVQY